MRTEKSTKTFKHDVCDEVSGCGELSSKRLAKTSTEGIHKLGQSDCYLSLKFHVKGELFTSTNEKTRWSHPIPAQRRTHPVIGFSRFLSRAVPNPSGNLNSLPIVNHQRKVDVSLRLKEHQLCVACLLSERRGAFGDTGRVDCAALLGCSAEQLAHQAACSSAARTARVISVSGTASTDAVPFWLISPIGSTAFAMHVCVYAWSDEQIQTR